MTATADSKSKTEKPSWREGIAVHLKQRVLIVLFLGFSPGLPLALSGSTLLVWMREVGANLGTLWLFGLVGTAFTAKLHWAALVDSLDVPVLFRPLGRRRGWLILARFLMMASVVFPGFCGPASSALLV